MGTLFDCLGIFGNNSIQINDKKYIIHKKIGEGGFSFVYKVKSSNQSYAMKKINIALPEQEQMTSREIHAYQSLEHTNIMKLVEYCINTKHQMAYLIFPIYENGSLQDYVDDTKKSLTNEQLIHLLNSLLSAIGYIHSQNYCHFDIKPANLLFKDHTHESIVICDLGSTDKVPILIKDRNHALQLKEKFENECTSLYRAPELFAVESVQLINEKCDIWSIGCTIYAIFYHTTPFDGSALSANSGKIQYHPNSDTISDQWKNLMNSIIKVKPMERPNIDQIIQILNSF